MAVYPDSYTILEEFLRAIPAHMRSKCFLDHGMSPEVNSLEDFVSITKEIEQNEKTEAYYKSQYSCHSVNTTTSSDDILATEITAVATRKSGLLKATQQTDVGSSTQAEPPTSTRTSNPSHPQAGDRRPESSTQEAKVPQKGNCFNCGKPGHYAHQCKEPQKREQKVHVRAAHSTVGTVDDDEEEPASPIGMPEDNVSDIEQREYVEFEAPINEWYGEDDVDFIH